MAHVDQNRKKGESIYGTYEGSKGALYYITTDGSGAISCTCPSFMSGKEAKGKAVKDRVCKHLSEVLAGRTDSFTPRPKAGSALSIVDEIKKQLEDVTKKLESATTADEITDQFLVLEKVNIRAHAFVDKLQEEIHAVNERIEAAVTLAKEKA